MLKTFEFRACDKCNPETPIGAREVIRFMLRNGTVQDRDGGGVTVHPYYENFDLCAEHLVEFLVAVADFETKEFEASLLAQNLSRYVHGGKVCSHLQR